MNEVVRLCQISNELQAIVEYAIDDEYNTCDARIYIQNMDGTEFRIEKEYTIQQMQRYFTKLNNNLIYGYVVINPTTGAIKINMFGMVGYNSKNEVDYKKYKEEVEFNGQQILQNLIFQILYRSAILERDLYLECINPQELKTQANDLSQKIKWLDEKLHKSHININDSERQQTKIKSAFQFPTQQGTLKNIFDKIEIYNYKSRQKQNNDNSNSNNDNSNDNSNNDNSNNANNANNANNYNDDNLRQFNKISQCTVSYLSKKNRTLIEKKQGQNTNFSNEIRILEIIGDYEHPYIAKYYRSDQEEHKQTLFIEKYFYYSLEEFLPNLDEITSLNTKIYFLYQIALGIKFLHDKNIIHLDIKDGNILVSYNYICKIADFEEAIVVGEKKKNYAFSQGYTAPEVILSNQNTLLTPQADIFSFGALIGSLVFKTKVIRAQTQEQYQNYKIYLDKDYALSLGSKQFMEFLWQMTIKCLQPQPQDRPDINWIIVLLKEMMDLIEKQS